MAGVVLATAGYDHTIRFWEAASGTCNRTVKYPDSVGCFCPRFTLHRGFWNRQISQN
jgi:hypothetical protein